MLKRTRSIYPLFALVFLMIPNSNVRWLRHVSWLRPLCGKCEKLFRSPSVAESPVRWLRHVRCWPNESTCVREREPSPTYIRWRSSPFLKGDLDTRVLGFLMHLPVRCGICHTRCTWGMHALLNLTPARHNLSCPTTADVGVRVWFWHHMHRGRGRGRGRGRNTQKNVRNFNFAFGHSK